MFRIPCLGTCFGRRSRKAHKGEDVDDSSLNAKVIKLEDKPRSLQPKTSVSLMTNKVFFSLEPKHMRSQIMKYSEPVQDIRRREYPNMEKGVYLDHSGATIYARSLIDDFSKAMISNLWGNPHSENLAAKMSGEMIDRIRQKTLDFLGADSDHFDLVFVANATAGIKLVGDAFRDLSEKTQDKTFWYGYHSEVHSSLLGVRQLSGSRYHCFTDDDDVEDWLNNSAEYIGGKSHTARLGLFAYPGQSNLSGRRLPKNWTKRIREQPHLRNTYSLFDAAALAMTSPLGSLFADPDAAPDFTCLSLYKIFGFPDLGALVVRRASGHILSLRKYFGGGTIAQVYPGNGDSRSVKKGPGLGGPNGHWSIHDGVEDGTLPFHSILALGLAIDTHIRLYGSMEAVSRHCTNLAMMLYDDLLSLRYADGSPVIEVYADPRTGYEDPDIQGATFAFNVLRRDRTYVSWMDVERMANTGGVYIRAGGVCCPGGVLKALQYEEWEWNRLFSSGHACGANETAIVNRRPTGIVRASIGAMTTESDLDALVAFLREAFVMAPDATPPHGVTIKMPLQTPHEERKQWRDKNSEVEVFV